MDLKRQINYQWQLFIPLVATIWLIIGILAYWQYYNERQYRKEQIDGQLDLVTKRIVASYETDFDPTKFVDFVCGYYRDNPLYDLLRVSVYVDGELSRAWGEPIGLSEKEVALSEGLTRTPEINRTPEDAEDSDSYFYYKVLKSNDERIVVCSVLPFDNDILSATLPSYSMFWFVIVLGVVATVSAYISTRYFGRNIKLLRTIAERAATDPTFIPAPDFPHDELGDISRQIVSLYNEKTKALDRQRREHAVALHAIEEKARNKRQLTNNINHELRTPIGVIKGYLDTIIENPDMDDASRTHFISKAQEHVQRLVNLIADVSAITRLEEGGDLISTEELDFHDVAFTIASDFEGSTLRELFRHADKNMYVDKNRANREEAEARKLQNQQLLQWVNAHGYQFSNCLYCDALLDQYRVLRTSAGFFLADNGSYSGAVEQIVDEYATSATRKTMREALQLSTLSAALSAEHPKQELALDFETDGVTQRGRLTLLFCDADLHGRLHHFLVGFEYFRDKSTAFDERQPLTQYYEQMKHSLLENDNYVDALIDANDALFTVDLTHGQLEQIFYRTTALRQFDLQMTLPCSYDDYCAQRRHFVTPETLENYRIVDTASKLLERFHSGFKHVTVEYREQTSCGDPVWLQKTVLMAQDTVFDAASGREMPVIHGIILFRDTSVFHAQEQAENQRLQEAFEEADSASKAKTAFMNRMSHDIRTPINGILGMLDILRSNRDDARKVASCLDKIDLSAHHLLALVNDVLDMSKLEAGQMVIEQEPFDIEVLLHDVSSLVEAQIEKDGLTHRRHRENVQHTALVGSSLKLRQIMVNLFSNAIKYNKPGGSIDTYARELSCNGTTVWYEFRITDTGIGMSRDFLENQLFKPFTQESADARTQYRGTGLGMSIVKELVSQMGGSISAESQLGEGTAFTFQLPFLLDKNAATKPQLKPTDNGRLDGMHILLVEDNDINMEVAEFQLTSQGAAVDKAWNGREAVERFAASAPGGYQAILMDVMMPVMDGFEASRAIRALDRPDAATVPILAMTAQASDECAQSCHQVGMNGRLVKPLDAKKLAKSIREAVQNQQ